MSFEVDGKEYVHERATATQQTGFTFVSQSRSWLPDAVGGILWFGVDDAASTVYFPMYSCSTRVPHAYAVGNGSMMEFTDQAAFWVFNQVTNFAYTRYNAIHPEIREKLWKEAFWSQSFCLLTAGGAPVEVIRQYIETQGEKKH